MSAEIPAGQQVTDSCVRPYRNPYRKNTVYEKGEKMDKTALLIVDVQTALTAAQPYQGERMLRCIGALLDACRKEGLDVIYVRHAGRPGGELELGSDGWQIAPEIAPTPAERIFDKQHNSAFLKTGLKAYLDERGVRHIILVGMQTEYCIDATVKAAFEQGFAITIPREGNTTVDNAFLKAEQIHAFFNDLIWAGRFARVLSLDAKNMKEFLRNAADA